ncbi:hypothetical protein [Sulfobacillus harzensis]|uniref:Uncharacterized protein n=1 Tax=Sulfobacillus harzensis TaxID=2729629 RepID=A0A7Y0L2C1_9FIRM|nr:hypothetical protein [Sulfobacillus harzensis]NMP21925.1 hypothetical protein [Sulfobacillus harzensis]
MIEVAILVLAAILFALSGRWKTTGWLPRTLYLLGGALIMAFVLQHRAALFVLGAGAIALSRIVPAHGWHKQPGEG